jgi:tetratricopeptide (TPR) repeat protein
MEEMVNRIKEIEAQVEKALWELEIKGHLPEVLIIYRDSETELESLGIEVTHLAYAEQQRVLAYCLMRQGNILRQQGKLQEALTLSEREIIAARASGDEIALARSLLSNGTNFIVAGKLDQGLMLIDEARDLFKKGDSFDHMQGLGWYWILQADLSSAGLLEREPAELIEIASRALDILTPIKNWPGVARAYAARATVYEKLGDVEQAENDRKLQKFAENESKSESIDN